MVLASVLDLATICEGGDAAAAFRNSVALAQRAEALGFHRFWLAEHHSMAGVASAATAVVVGHVAAATSRIRVGAGGIMLPNHAPLLIAEQFGTLESMYPGRIDLGLGRAPGSSSLTQRALRRDSRNADRFVEDVLELQQWFAPRGPGQRVFAVPGAGLAVPLWILGSSTFGANVAAQLGLPYAFASHFAPGQLRDALAVYRSRFRPSQSCPKPRVMLALNVVAADSAQEARHLYSSLQQAFLNLSAGHPGPFPAPREFAPDATESVFLNAALSASVVGDLGQVHAGIGRFLNEHQADELILTAPVYDLAARLHSLELAAEALSTL